jgi:hypothetical protein
MTAWGRAVIWTGLLLLLLSMQHGVEAAEGVRSPKLARAVYVWGCCGWAGGARWGLCPELACHTIISISIPFDFI